MSIYVGGYNPVFKFRLNSIYSDPYIITSGTTGVSTGQFIDTRRTIISYTAALTGTQYSVQVVPEQYYPIGETRQVVLSSSDTGKATVDQNGNTRFISTGNFDIIGFSSGYSYVPNEQISIRLQNISGGGNTTLVTSYVPDNIDPSKHILIVYNSGSSNSTNLKTYYTGNRPLFSGANVLGIACPSTETTSYNTFLTGIRQPIINYLTGVSGTKPIRYIINMMEIPTRVSDTITSSVPVQLASAFKSLGLRNGTNYEMSNNRFSLGEYQGNTALITYINFGNYSDCTGYIKRISSNQTGIYLTGNTQNTGYYIDDTNILYPDFYPTFCSGRYLRPALNQNSAIKYLYRPVGNGYITTGNNIAAFVTWGAHAGRGPNYAVNGQIRWGGNNNWYIMTTIESYNGLWNNAGTSQGNFTGWFSSGAFGGRNYENCPVGAVCHVNEPGLQGVAYTGFFMLWERGFPFIEAAWQSRVTSYFLAVGDPLTTIRPV